MALRWGHLMTGGTALDAACGLGRGIASAGDRFDRIVAVDLSEVAVRQARRLWAGRPGIWWVVGDVTRLAWPPTTFGLVCAFGFTDLPFLARVATFLAPGGMLLYEGFAERERTVRPNLDLAWTATPDKLYRALPGWRVLECEESAEPPFRVRLAAFHPSQGVLRTC